jgi:pilus assembly protein CpaC
MMIAYMKSHSRAIISLLGSILFCLVLLSPVMAVAEMSNADKAASRKVTVAVGQSVIVDSPVTIKKIALAAPEIADITVLSPRQIYLVGKTPGVTNGTIWGTDGKISAMLDIEVAPNVVRLKERIHEMIPNEKDIKVTASPDGVVLTGTVSNTQNLSQVAALAQAYAPKDKDGKPKVMNLLEVGGVHQVMLEVRVSEMSRTLLRRLGVNFAYDYGGAFGISLLKNLTNLPTAGWPGNPISVGSNINAILHFTNGAGSWTAFVDALKEEGLTKVLAEPTLITMSGRTANFLAGGEYPIPVPQGTGAGTTITIDYKTFGVGLNFTPTVLSNNKISMEVRPEVSELDFTNAVAISGYVVPSLTTRRVQTVIELADGQSFAIAGLLRDDIREIVTKFPVLGDIPVLGVLFRSTSFQKSETELVIIVTPHLVKPVDMTKQTLPTDAYVEPNDFEWYLLGSLEGRGEPTKSSKGAMPPRSDKGGLEGDFGHIAPK